MKRNFLPNWLAALKPILASGILIVGLRLAQDSISVSQAQAQTAARSSSLFTATTSLPAAEVQALSQPAMTSSASNIRSNFTPISSTDIAPIDFGSGEDQLRDVSDLSDQQRQAAQQDIERNIKRLGLNRSGNLAPFSTALAWPIRAASSLSDYGFHAIGAFVDHNPANPNQLQDYECGTRTYGIAGYNHQGTDISLWPFGWNKMDNSEVEIVAAAPGTIVAKYDGNFDRSCNMNLNQWNGVVIQHADGSTAWYVHMKENSVTSKIVGEIVVTGEYLGVVGSSGSSSGPHLHFEVQAAGTHAVIDPYAGACNNITSWWTAQRPYYDSAVNTLTTGDAAPVFQVCPNPTITHVKDQFNPGDTIYFTIYYRDILASLPSAIKVYKPDGAVYRNWTYPPSQFYSASYWYGSAVLAANVPPGQWKFEVTFNGQTYTHHFFVGYQVTLHGQPSDQAIYLNWDVPGGVPITSTWQIAYAGMTGTQVSPITGLISSTRAYSLTGLTNYTWYTITLNAKVNANSIVTDTVSLMPTGLLVYLPLVLK